MITVNTCRIDKPAYWYLGYSWAECRLHAPTALEYYSWSSWRDRFNKPINQLMEATGVLCEDTEEHKHDYC